MPCPGLCISGALRVHKSCSQAEQGEPSQKWRQRRRLVGWGGKRQAFERRSGRQYMGRGRRRRGLTTRNARQGKKEAGVLGLGLYGSSGHRCNSSAVLLCGRLWLGSGRIGQRLLSARCCASLLADQFFRFSPPQREHHRSGASDTISMSTTPSSRRLMLTVEARGWQLTLRRR